MHENSPLLLLRLHRLAVGNDENFLTESLAFLLEYLLENEPGLGLELLNRLIPNQWKLEVPNALTVTVKTQVTTSEGCPDIEIRCMSGLGECRAFVEVKVESPLGDRQLERYQNVLKQNKVPPANTVLTLLSRYPIATEETVKRVRWHEIAEWVEGAGPKAQTDTTRFLFRQIVGLLRGRGMTMDQVGWEMPDGVRGFRSLMDMLYEAATGCEANPWKYYSWDFFGYSLAKERYWVGLYFNNPDSIFFETYKCPINLGRAESLTEGRLEPSESAPGGMIWQRELNLNSEEVHFFARSKASQIQLLEKFLRESIHTANGITESIDSATHV